MRHPVATPPRRCDVAGGLVPGWVVARALGRQAPQDPGARRCEHAHGMRTVAAARRPRRWLLCAALAGAALSWAPLLRAAPADEAVLAARGRALYHGHVEFAAGAATTPLRLPPALLACARCHGATGAGGREGGQPVPPLGADALYRPRGALPAWRDERAVLRAVTRGVGRDGRALEPLMPRFALSAAEQGALAAYLRQLGSEHDRPPGVDADRVRLASVLPLSGPGADTGQALAAGLRAGIDEANARGGVHGRRLLLVLHDARAGVPAALAAGHAQPPYALVGGLWNESVERAEPLLAAARLSHVASLVVREQPPRPADWSADLLAPLALQRAALAHALGACPAGPRLGAAHGAPPAAPAADGLRWLPPDAALATLLRGSPPGCIAYTLPRAAAVQAALPPGWQRTLVLPMPAAVLQPEATSGVGASPWYRLGLLSARLAVELLSRAGRALHERALLDQLDGLTELTLAPRVPVHYGRQRRHGWTPELLALDAPPDASAADPGAAAPGGLTRGGS